jgi:hypothetical protein
MISGWTPCGDVMHFPSMTDATIAWLSASDPAIHWQLLRDLLDAPAPVWQAERARVETAARLSG